jgi:hypothetical protein
MKAARHLEVIVGVIYDAFDPNIDSDMPNQKSSNDSRSSLLLSQAIRVFRVARAFRTLRVVRRSPRLMLIVNTIASSVRLLLAAGYEKSKCRDAGGKELTWVAREMEEK